MSSSRATAQDTPSNQQDTKTRIIESARDIYLQEGLHGLSMRKVAKLAGVSTMAAYRHFESKDELVSHVVMQGFQLFQRYFYRALEGDSPASRLQLSSSAYLQFALDNPEYYAVMFMPVAHVSRVSPGPQAQRLIDAAVQFLYDRIAECVRTGVMPGPVSKRQVIHLWSHAHGLISLYLSGLIDSSARFDTLYHESMALMMQGMGFQSPTA